MPSAPPSPKLKEYAESLPKIYRDIMSAFPAVEPDRHPGYGLALTSITTHVSVGTGRFSQSRFAKANASLEVAAERLEEAGLVELRNGFFLHPTPLGERIITALTGHVPSPDPVPDLPSPPAELYEES